MFMRDLDRIYDAYWIGLQHSGLRMLFKMSWDNKVYCKCGLSLVYTLAMALHPNNHIKNAAAATDVVVVYFCEWNSPLLIKVCSDYSLLDLSNKTKTEEQGTTPLFG